MGRLTEELLVNLSAWGELLHCLIYYFLEVSLCVESFLGTCHTFVVLMDDTGFDNLSQLYF